MKKLLLFFFTVTAFATETEMVSKQEFQDFVEQHPEIKNIIIDKFPAKFPTKKWEDILVPQNEKKVCYQVTHCVEVAD